MKKEEKICPHNDCWHYEECNKQNTSVEKPFCYINADWFKEKIKKQKISKV